MAGDRHAPGIRPRPRRDVDRDGVADGTTLPASACAVDNEMASPEPPSVSSVNAKGVSSISRDTLASEPSASLRFSARLAPEDDDGKPTLGQPVGSGMTGGRS